MLNMAGLVNVGVGDYKLVRGSWWLCVAVEGAEVRWESVDPPRFVRRRYRTMDAMLAEQDRAALAATAKRP